MLKENDRTELKECLTPELEKEAVAFLNAKGGHIYIGVRDDGSVHGVQNPDELQLKIKDRLINNIRPSIMGLFEVDCKEIDGKNVVIVGLASGVAQPYYIKQKGRSEAGYFVRIGTSAQSMTEEMLDKMLSKRLPVSLTNLPARRQDLTFAQLKIYYEGKNKNLNSRFADNLSFYTPDGQYNQVAYLFADENRFSFRFAKWFGNEKIDLIQNEEYGDRCVITAMERMIDCMDVENVTQAKKTERYRVEKKYVDRKALRECIINAFAHNDYSESNTPVFEVFDDRFEITTYGDLLAWIDKDSFFNGISRPRNPEIMRIFRDLEYVENLGSGIPYIIKLYGQDIFQFSKVATKVVLQKEILGMDFWDSISETTPKLHQKTTPKTISVSPKSKDKVLMYMRNYPQISTKRLAELMDMSVDGIKYISKRLQAMQQIRRVCPSRGGHWEVIENNTDN